jgi:dCMP deaminase
VSKKWDNRMLQLAQHIAGWSKDYSTQVGSVIAQGNRVVGLGYNGPARGVKDSRAKLSREVRLAITIHGEANALAMAGDKAQGATLYVWPLPPCSTCAALAIQAGIRRIVAQPPSPALARRWEPSLRLARAMLAEAGVALELLSPEITDV